MRKEPDACVFVGSENAKNASARAHVQAESMQDRIDRLETIISSLVSKNNDTQKEAVPQEITPADNSSSQVLAEDTYYGHGQQAVDDIETTLLSSPLEPDEFEANELIKAYQNETVNQSPFVILPPGTTSSDLRQKLPLLYNAVILATSSHHPTRQAFYEKQIVEVVTDQLLIHNNKSLELLQSILLVITWSLCPPSNIRPYLLICVIGTKDLHSSFLT